MYDAAQVVQDGLQSGRRLWGEARWTRDARQRGGEHAIREHTGSSSSTHARTDQHPPALVCSLSLSLACLHDARTSLLYSGAAAQAARRPSLRRIDDNPPNLARRPTERNGRVLLLLRSLANSSCERNGEGCYCPTVSRNNHHCPGNQIMLTFFFASLPRARAYAPRRRRVPPRSVSATPRATRSAVAAVVARSTSSTSRALRAATRRPSSGRVRVCPCSAPVWLVLLTNQREKQTTADEWGQKAKRRHTTGTGRMQYMKHVSRRFKNGSVRPFSPLFVVTVSADLARIPPRPASARAPPPPARPSLRPSKRIGNCEILVLFYSPSRTFRLVRWCSLARIPSQTVGSQPEYGSPCPSFQLARTERRILGIGKDERLVR